MSATLSTFLDQWLPISGALKDGNRIIAARIDLRNTEDKPFMWWTSIVSWDESRGRWTDGTLFLKPTHYQPFPKGWASHP